MLKMKKLKDKLSPFKSTSGYHGNVVLNFTNNSKKELSCYADAFHDAGKILVNDIKTRNGYSDLEACPIVFLYRHALELHFKSMLIIGKDVLLFKKKDIPIEKDEIYSTHSLLKLLPAVKFVIEEVGWSWDLGIEGFKKFDHFKIFIEAIDYIDPMSFAFRYPINKKVEIVDYH